MLCQPTINPPYARPRGEQHGIGLGFRILGVRVYGFGVLGFRVLGCMVLVFRVCIEASQNPAKTGTNTTKHVSESLQALQISIRRHTGPAKSPERRKQQ